MTSTMHVRTPDGQIRDIPGTAESIWPWLESGVVRMMAGGRVPPIYSTMRTMGFRYHREPMVSGRRRDNYNTYDRVIAEGSGDCEDLAMWRVANLRQSGRQAVVGLIAWPGGNFHAVVLRRGPRATGEWIYPSPSQAYHDGRVRIYGGPEWGWNPADAWVEDPSYALAMPDESRDLDVAGPETGFPWLAFVPIAAAAAGLIYLLANKPAETGPQGRVKHLYSRLEGKRLTNQQVGDLMLAVGFPASAIAKGIEIVTRESGRWTRAVGAFLLKSGRTTRDRGLWQFSSIYHPGLSDEQAFDPVAATRYAYEQWRKHGWQPWKNSETAGAPGETPYTREEIAEILERSGWKPSRISTGVRIVMRESEGYPHARSKSGLYRGWWQLARDGHPLSDPEAYDPEISSTYAHSLWSDRYRQWPWLRQAETGSIWSDAYNEINAAIASGLKSWDSLWRESQSHLETAESSPAVMTDDARGFVAAMGESRRLLDEMKPRLQTAQDVARWNHRNAEWTALHDRFVAAGAKTTGLTAIVIGIYVLGAAALAWAYTMAPYFRGHLERVRLEHDELMERVAASREGRTLQPSTLPEPSDSSPTGLIVPALVTIGIIGAGAYALSRMGGSRQ